MMTVILVALVAFALGAAVAAVVLNSRATELRSRLAAAQAELSASGNNVTALQQQLGESGRALSAAAERASAAATEAARLGEQLRQQELRFKEQLQQREEQLKESRALLESAKEELSNKFKALAGEILEEKTARFTKTNQENMSQLLTPLSTQIKTFQEQVEKVYVQESKDRTALGEQVKLLMGLNQQLSGETGRLTRALTSSAKAQGDLGEMILEKILESSGLRKDEEYVVQGSFRNADDRQSRPDVIVNLPERKHLVIDSKVSLTAYNEYVNAEDDETRRAALKQHMGSVERHIKELSEKNYHALHQLQSIDFVCMFVPIEGAFLAAIAEDATLWESSYRKNILLVSPSTLLFVVRTVAHLWRQERQKENVAEIVSRGAELYDKLAGFVDELKNVGDRLEQARTSYGVALNRLSTGKGNVIRQAEMLKSLGVKPKKSLPVELIAASAEDAEDLPLLAEGADAAEAP
jgi:DNA recombination protein RmuC